MGGVPAEDEATRSILADRLAGAVRTYLDEIDCPAPDMTMRGIRRNELRAALANYERHERGGR